MKTIMKNILILAAIVLIGAACNKSADKKAQLADLKKQRDELTVKIQTLEEDLGKKDPGANVKMTTVAIAAAEKTTFDHFLEVQGRVDGEDNIAVSAQTPGVITSVLVKEGDAVKRGQVMALTDNSVLRQQIENVKTQLNFATNLYTKQKSLWDQQIGSEVQYLTSKNSKESLEANLAALNDQLEMTKIKSPINGTVEEVNLKIGQMASPGMPAVRVVNFSSAKVVTDIAETYAQQVKKGDKVIVFFPDFDKEVETKVHFTSKYINPVNRTFSTEVKLQPGELAYRANMLAVVKINDYSNPSTFVIPISLIKESSGGKYIYLAKEENGKLTARRQIIEVGRNYNGMAEVTSGLKEGDKLITTGYNNLVEGQLIKVNGTKD